MEDLVEWLRLQLDEDERVAREATPGPWQVNGYDEVETVALDGIPGRGTPMAVVQDGAGISSAIVLVDALFVAAHDPARELREVEAKRRIVNSFAAGMEFEPLRRGTESYAIVRMVLKLLTLPYSDRPGYREEWKP